MTETMNQKEHNEETQKEEGHVVPHIISLGAGVQSSTMALMAAVGEITPMPIAAIFADTQDEPKSVYKWLDWLEKQLPFPVLRVSKGSLSQHALRAKKQADGSPRFDSPIPVFLKSDDGQEGKIVSRQCTHDFKVAPIQAALREMANIRRGQKEVGCIQWIGISLDEIVRMKLSRHAWLGHRWPLVELRMRRDDCLRWMREKGFPEPPRSACVYCPFHSDREWRRLKTEDAEAFQSAVYFERLMRESQQKSNNFRKEPFLHRSCVPLDEVDFSTDIERGQTAWWEENFRDECEGMCGV